MVTTHVECKIRRTIIYKLSRLIGLLSFTAYKCWFVTEESVPCKIPNPKMVIKIWYENS